MAEQHSVVGVVKRFLEDYVSGTPTKLKLIDAYLGYIVITGVVQVGSKIR
jgi:oligosaccharyltransferase complex subunit epsilon